MTDIPIQILLTSIFIFIGSITFYMSTLISGHNIYKDLSPQFAMFVTAILGFIIFIFSPISFLVLDPSLLNPFLSESEKKNEFLKLFYEKTYPMGFVSFLLSSVGIGLVSGCFTCIQARWNLLSWLRKFTGLDFPVYMYADAWDLFFRTIKRGGQVSLLLNSNKKIEGNLINYSVKSEPKQLIIYNPNISSVSEINSPSSAAIMASARQRPLCGLRAPQHWRKEALRTQAFTKLADTRIDTPLSDKYSKMEERIKDNVSPSGRVLILGENEIKAVLVPSYSFKRHYDTMDHVSFSFYLSVSFIGFFLLYCSSVSTSKFISDKFYNNYPGLANLYNILSVLFIIFSSICIYAAYRVSRKDFRTRNSYIALCSAIPIAVVLSTLVLYYMVIYTVTVFLNVMPDSIYTANIAVNVTFYVLVIYMIMEKFDFIKHIRDILDKFSNHESRYVIKTIIEYIYTVYNLNEEYIIDKSMKANYSGISHTKQFESIEKRLYNEITLLNNKKYKKIAENFLTEIRKDMNKKKQFIWQHKNSYLIGEEYNIVYRLKKYLEKEANKGISASIMDSTDPAVDLR